MSQYMMHATRPDTIIYIIYILYTIPNLLAKLVDDESVASPMSCVAVGTLS